MLRFFYKIQAKQQAMQRRKHYGKILFFSLFSAVISGMATLFLTPKSGREMRSMTQKEAQHAGKTIQKVSKDAQQKASKAGQVATEKSKNVMEKIRESFNNSKPEIETEVINDQLG